MSVKSIKRIKGVQRIATRVYFSIQSKLDTVVYNVKKATEIKLSQAFVKCTTKSIKDNALVHKRINEIYAQQTVDNLLYYENIAIIRKEEDELRLL